MKKMVAFLLFLLLPAVAIAQREADKRPYGHFSFAGGRASYDDYRLILVNDVGRVRMFRASDTNFHVAFGTVFPFGKGFGFENEFGYMRFARQGFGAFSPGIVWHAPALRKRVVPFGSLGYTVLISGGWYASTKSFAHWGVGTTVWANHDVGFRFERRSYHGTGVLIREWRGGIAFNFGR